MENLQAAREGILTYQRVHGASLAHNRLGDTPDRDVLIYLPPGYLSDSNRRFPVVYLLHGYNEANTVWRDGHYQGFHIKESLDSLIHNGKVCEMIVVMPDGRNAYGGCYFTNSSVTGNWGDYISGDLVRYVDRTYRTLPNRLSRGIAGQSMGGYSAIYLAMNYPQTFSSVYGLSPCCLDFIADIREENPEWPQILRLKTRRDLVEAHLTTTSQGNYPNALLGLAAAISPNPEKPPLYVEWPFELIGNEVRRVDRVYQQWLNHFPSHMIESHREELRQLSGIRFTAGKYDHLSHLPRGSQSFSEGLTRAGIPHTFELEETDHSEAVREWLEERVFPYFSQLLQLD